MATSSNSRNAELSWAGRVRTGNRQSFEYAKDNEVICLFKEPLLREQIYKEVEKDKVASYQNYRFGSPTGWPRRFHPEN